MNELEKNFGKTGRDIVTGFEGVITGVEPQGELKITTLQAEERRFLFKEIEFVLKN